MIEFSDQNVTSLDRDGGLDKNRPARKSVPKRWEAIQGLNVNFPGPGESLFLKTEPSPTEANHRGAEQLVQNAKIDYPRLLTVLRDQGLPFQARYSQGETAKIIGVSDRTVRDWTQAGKMSCCYYPSGRP